MHHADDARSRIMCLEDSRVVGLLDCIAAATSYWVDE